LDTDPLTNISTISATLDDNFDVSAASCTINVASAVAVLYLHTAACSEAELFQATVETVLLYGCEASTLTPTLERSLKGCYTRMLRAALNIKWWQHVLNSELYDNLPEVGDKVAARRMGLVRFCSRHPELPAGKVIL